MRPALYIFAAGLAIYFSALLYASYRDDASHADIPFPEPVAGIEDNSFQNIIVRSGDTLISGQPTEAGLQWAKDQGVATVVSVRTPHEMNDREIVPFDEAQTVADLGMTYVHVPMGGDDHPYNPEALEAVAAAFKAAEGPVLLHCTVGWRASHVWAAYLVAHRGLSPDEAVERARAAYMTEQPFEGLLGGTISYQKTEPEKAH